MEVSAFDFILPEERIATRPATPRDAARMLRVTPSLLEDRAILDLPRYVRPGDVMVFNDTRVIPARLHGRCGSAAVEATLHRRRADGVWDAFVRPARRFNTGGRFEVAEDFHATVTDKGEGGEVTLQFNVAGRAFDAALARYGIMPLPPYIARRRPADGGDRERYQTVYAARDGAVAAPTAGLHFTERLLAALDEAGVRRAFVTLHVGAGTFLPVKAEHTEQHVMHREWYEVSEETAALVNEAKAAGGRVIAVGTTGLRALESATDASGMLRPFRGDTAIFITPGYRFRMADALLTNFHLPRSTLFMLVSAFSGLERMREAYRHAIARGYRFYSYGDACLLERAA